MPVHERRLHRMWRRVVELEHQVEKDHVDGNLLRKTVSDFHEMRRSGLLDAETDFSDLAVLRQTLEHTLLQTAKEVSDDRFAAWREKARSSGMKPLFDYINGVRPGVDAVGRTQGVTADPAVILSGAERVPPSPPLCPTCCLLRKGQTFHHALC